MMTQIGETVIYQAWGGAMRTLTVKEASDDIKNEMAGFAGDSYWGYDHQIVTIYRAVGDETKLIFDRDAK